MRVRISQLAIDITPGKTEYFRQGKEFECPEERARQLGNSVIILPDPVETPTEPTETLPGKKRR